MGKMEELFSSNFPNLYELYKLTRERMAATNSPGSLRSAIMWLKPTMDHLEKSGLDPADFDDNLSEEVARRAMNEWHVVKKEFGLGKTDPFLTC